MLTSAIGTSQASNPLSTASSESQQQPSSSSTTSTSMTTIDAGAVPTHDAYYSALLEQVSGCLKKRS
jgi:hypothetical protein